MIENWYQIILAGSVYTRRYCRNRETFQLQIALWQSNIILWKSSILNIKSHGLTINSQLICFGILRWPPAFEFVIYSVRPDPEALIVIIPMIRRWQMVLQPWGETWAKCIIQKMSNVENLAQQNLPLSTNMLTTLLYFQIAYTWTNAEQETFFKKIWPNLTSTST